MKIQDFLRLIGGPPRRLNFFVLAPDELGLTLLLQKALGDRTATHDLYFHDAEGVTKEKARQIEAEARLGARGGSELQTHFIHSLQKLPTDSAGPLLKVVEDALFARFIFQAQSTPRKLHTLMSRSAVVRLPFLTKAAVLANLKAMNQDAKTADELGLYDGTLEGTLRALAMKDTITNIRREMGKGTRGLASLFNPDLLNSNAFEKATYDHLTDQERKFLGKRPTNDRKKIALYLATMRAS
jgi:hypothetical protein